jgi:hypothetical protein
MFDRSQISIATHLKSESEYRQCSFEVMGIIDGIHRLDNRHIC